MAEYDGDTVVVRPLGVSLIRPLSDLASLQIDITSSNTEYKAI
jgi:hypothetical protein